MICLVVVLLVLIPCNCCYCYYVVYIYVHLLLVLLPLSCMCLCGRLCVLLNSVIGNVSNNTTVISLGVSWLEIAVIQNCYDCLFVYLPAYLFLKLFNKCEHVIVGVVLSEHSEKCHSAIFCQCQTHSLSLVSMKKLKLKVALLWNTLSCMISASSSTELYLNHNSYQFLWPWSLCFCCCCFLTKLWLLETIFLFLKKI